MSDKKKYPLFLLTAFCFSGCSVAPRYVPPVIPLPDQWHSPLCPSLAIEPSETFVWWEALEDPMLNYLLEKAAEQNLSLHIALNRIKQARQSRKGAEAGLYPQIDGTLSYNRFQGDKKFLRNFLAKESHKFTVYEMGLDTAWEIDLFGKQAHEIAAQSAYCGAAEETLRDGWVMVSAEIARSYIELRAAQKQLELIENNIENHREALELSKGLVSTGLGSLLQQRQAQEELYSLYGEKPLIELTIEKTIHHLAVLTGFCFEEAEELLRAAAPLPKLPENNPIGYPSELLRRRADIRHAERQLAAATELVGSATAALFPRFSLKGFIGNIASHLSSHGLSFWASPELLLPIFNSSELQQDVTLNKIKVEEALYTYQKTVLEALEEAENSIAAFNSYRQRAHYLGEIVELYEGSGAISQQLYQQGFNNYIDLLAEKAASIRAQESYLQSEKELFFEYIFLYKALGG